MRRLALAACIALALVSAVAQGTPAAGRGISVAAAELGAGAAIGRQYLVLVGIDAYRDPSWPALRNPVKDCRELRQIIAERYYIDEVIELYDDKASSKGVYALFGDLQKRLQVNDSLLFYYAGHGNLSSVTDVGYIIPSDGGGTPGEGWISNAEIRGWLRKLASRHVCLMLDSCFSGDILDDRRSMRPAIDSEYFRTAYAKQSRQVLTSGASQTVPDDSEFAYQLKTALRGNSKPFLDPLMIYNEIRSGMRRTQPLFGSVKDSGHQEGGSFLLFLKEGDPPAARIAAAQVASAPPALVERSLAKAALEAGEAVEGIVASADAQSLALVTSRQEGVLKKTRSYYVRVGGRRLGPFPRLELQEKGSWIAQDASGAWYVGSASSSLGPMAEYSDLFWARGLADRRLAFKADVPEGEYLSEGTKRGTLYERVWNVTPSPGDSTVAYVGYREGKYRVVVGDRASEPFDDAGNLVWSPDGSLLAYTAAIGAGTYVCAGARRIGPYERVDSLTFAPDGKTLVYCADRCIFAGDERLGPYKNTVENVVFSPDGSRFAFSVSDSPDPTRTVHLDSGETYGPYLSWTLSYSFSPDGRTFFCAGYDMKSDKLVVHMGRERTVAEGYGPATPYFSRDGRQAAFAVDVDWDEWELRVGNRKLGIASDLACGILPDGSPLYWRNGEDGRYLVAGGEERGPFAAVSDISDASTFRFVAWKDGEIRLLSRDR